MLRGRAGAEGPRRAADGCRHVRPQARAPWHHRGAVTSAVYAVHALGGSVVVAAMALAHGGNAQRFGLIALLTGVAAVVLVSFAPRSLPARVAESPAFQ